MKIAHEEINTPASHLSAGKVYPAFNAIWSSWLYKGAPAGNYKLTLRLERDA